MTRSNKAILVGQRLRISVGNTSTYIPIGQSYLSLLSLFSIYLFYQALNISLLQDEGKILQTRVGSKQNYVVVDIPTDRIGAAIDVTDIPPESKSDFSFIPLGKNDKVLKVQGAI